MATKVNDTRRTSQEETRMKTGVATKSSRARSVRGRARRKLEARQRESANRVSRDTERRNTFFWVDENEEMICEENENGQAEGYLQIIQDRGEQTTEIILSPKDIEELREALRAAP